MSREAFAELLGVKADWDWGQSYYDVVQQQLKLFGGQRPVDKCLEQSSGAATRHASILKRAAFD
jgi:hypothetical protein